ncbi:hypothetical protein [Pseudomonas aeruginosa]
MDKAFLAIQCKAPNGATGTFLYRDKNEDGYVLASPVMADCVALFAWAKASWGAASWLEPDPCDSEELAQAKRAALAAMAAATGGK